MCQQEEVWQKQNSKQTNYETQAIPLPEMLVKPNSSAAKEHQGTPLFSRLVVSSYKGPILLLFGCGTRGLFESMVYFNLIKKISIQLSERKVARSQTLTFLSLYKYVCRLTSITHLVASPKTFLVLHIKYSNVIRSFVHGSSLGLILSSLLLKNRSPENFVETDCRHTKHLSSKPQWPLLTELTRQNHS